MVGTRYEAVVQAYNKGYRVTESGSVVSPSGLVRKLRLRIRKTYRMLEFSINVMGSIVAIPVHRLAAYQKFKEKIAEPGMVVRHLDGDSTNNSQSNIGIGTASENSNDRPVIDRVRHARMAGSANSLPESVWTSVESDYKSGIGYKRLSRIYGIALSTLSYRLSKRAKKTRFAVDKFIERQTGL